MTLYVGVTNNLERRMYEHRNPINPGFTQKYKIEKVVYFESGYSINDAIEREKRIKGWGRAKKIDLIEKQNPKWRDLQIDSLLVLGVTNTAQDDSRLLEMTSGAQDDSLVTNEVHSS